jgi:hypothetical protein
MPLFGVFHLVAMAIKSKFQIYNDIYIYIQIYMYLYVWSFSGLFSASFITEGHIDINSFCWAWVRIVVNRELEYNYYSKEVRKGWNEARCNGLWMVEVD